MLERSGIVMASEPPQHTDAGARADTTIVLQNDLVELERLGALVASLGRECEWPDGIAQHVELALDEIVTNIISYAYDDDGPHDIVIRLAASRDEVRVEVADDGRPFDPVTAPEAVTGGAIDERPVGGLGWHLVRSVVDVLEYHRIGGRNVVTFVKRLAALS